MIRLDKYISTLTTYSRAETKKIIKKGVLVNDKLIKSSDYKIDEENDIVVIDGQRLVYQKYIYIMMNKPQDVISATEDKKEKTVIDILNEHDRVFKPFPVGRLDKNTEGLMFITNDGELSHKLLSPKKDIDKKYYVEVDGVLTEEDVEKVKQGLILEDGYKCKSAKLEIIDSLENKSTAHIVISEGKFHQIKRMMKILGKNVTYLKRLTIGSLQLDKNLQLGQYRYLTEEEIKKLKNNVEGHIYEYQF